MDKSMIEAQSKSAYGQWCDQWRSQAKIHSKFKMKSFSDLENSGIGRAVLCVANGYSFEENIETIKKHKDNVDILCCDKSLGHLLNNGIKPKYVVICDANVNYEKYLSPYLDQLSETIALVNVCANPQWTENIKWKDIYFFVNKDIIDSHLEFSEISGCKNFIPAGTNVSNAMIILLTQSDNEGRRNFFGYDKILLIGYDYSWKDGGKYYAFDQDGGKKSQYMRHCYIVDMNGDFAYTSGNLSFSAKWFMTYAQTFKLPIVQCSKNTILNGIRYGNLEDQMQYKYKPEDSARVLSLVSKLKEVLKNKKDMEKKLISIGRDHELSFMASV
ncbi:MAG TPA: 6-hydroxymethylpterin diphosphokinase MptE-like protein [Gammaproteobacteria bacterium]|nr:6-hydroxymethylpterin diphosphokinase MptE-like protein [Gammaproteobacteria bacterium]